MADLHLGSPFKGLSVSDPDAQHRFAQAVRDAVSALVSRALAAKVDFVVIAGDIYDGEWKDASVGLFFNREMARLARADIPVFLIKGNHDAQSVVTRSVTLPDSVETFGVSKPRTRTIDHLRVALHGQSYKDRETLSNLARDYPAAKPGWFNIGVLHTSLSGDEDHAPYAPCSEADLVAKGYDYWALGHIHQPRVVRERPPIVYPGNVQGRSVRETGPRGAVLVRVRDGEPTVERWDEDRVRWGVTEVDLAGADDMTADLPERVEAAVAEAVAGADGRPLALRVRLVGETGLHNELVANADEVRAEVQAAAERVSADVWLEKVKVATRPHNASPSLAPDLPDDFDLDGLLATVADGEALQRVLDADLAQLAKALGGDPGEGFEADDILLEARALLAARIGGA